MTTKIRIDFEVSDGTTVDQVHEWLCQAIHERDEVAISELELSVIDIIHPDNQ